MILGLGMLFLLSDGIAQASWLSGEERSMLIRVLVEDENNQPATVSDSFGAVLRNPGVWVLGAIYFCNRAAFTPSTSGCRPSLRTAA